ncbi:MAG: Bug family tripartite tricarboxylate transporter substrate binding protein [Beijerinckiaceae bacterium]
MSTARRRVAPVLALALAAAISAPALASDYYAGKQITFIIGTSPGGGFDIYGRTVARHLPRHIPGAPVIVVQNMNGASSMRAAGYIYNVAPKDGTVIGAISPGAVVGPLLEGKSDALYDPTKFHFLATANNSARVCATFGTSGTRTFADALKRETIIGSVAEGGSTRDYAYLHKNTSKAKFRIIAGYKGTPDVLLAMERGEVEGICGLDWSSLRAQKGDYIRDGKLNILVQTGLEPNDELTRMGVPQIWSFFDNDEDRAVAELVIAQQLFGRPYIAPPGAAPEAVKILRAAFLAALRDPALLSDAERSQIDIAPAGGERVQEGVQKIYGAPARIVERAKDAIRR